MTRRKVLLIGWDAADWKVINPLMAAGKMPNVQRLVANGSTGQIATLHPPFSPMLWTSIATGKRPFKHGIHGFTEPTPDGRGVQPVTNLSRTCKAVWNILNQNDLRSIVIGWWPSHPAEPLNGVTVSDHYHRAHRPLSQGFPLLPGAVHPPELHDVLAGVRMHPDRLTPEMVLPFVPLAAEIDQDKDRRLAGLMRTLAECSSIHAAATWLLDHQTWDFFAVYYDAIDHFCHGFMRYHPPRQPWISERDFELYSNVVSMACQRHDEMLGELLQRVGDEVTVILMSDHGFHPDHLRPSTIPDIPAGPAVEHRDFGILALRGPGIRKDELLHGPSVLDIAPTILTLYGLPVGEDMDGKVLTQAFIAPPEVALIPSWEGVPGNDGRHPPHTRLDPVAAHEALEQLVALGYIEKPDKDVDIAVTRTIRELRYNLAEAYQDADRYIEARDILRELYAADPDEQRFAVQLFFCCQALDATEFGMIAEMRRIVDDLDGRRAQPPVVDFLKAQLLVAEKRYEEALAALDRVSSVQETRPDLLLQAADLCIKLRRWSEAEMAFQRALDIDPDNVHAHIGMCRMALRRRRFEPAAQHALDALQRTYHYPLAHFLLGLALIGLKDYERAADALRAAISFNPNFPEAHVRLATLLEKHIGDPPGAEEHRRLARRMRTRRIVRPHPVVTAAHAGKEVVSTPVPDTPMPPQSESLIVVSGLPRSGTSMFMQMLAAGGLPLLTDARREADEDNPRGYLEYEPVKNILRDTGFLRGCAGKAVKIVAPLLSALPPGLPCRVILSERDLDEVLDSQQKMIARRGRETQASKPEGRALLREEYVKTLARVKAMLARRPQTALLIMDHAFAIANPTAAAAQINEFLGGTLDTAKMAAAVDPKLHRNRR